MARNISFEKLINNPFTHPTTYLENIYKTDTNNTYSTSLSSPLSSIKYLLKKKSTDENIAPITIMIKEPMILR